MIKCITNVTTKTVAEDNRRKLTIHGTIIGVSIVLMVVMLVVAKTVNTTTMTTIGVVVAGVAFIASMVSLIVFNRIKLEYYTSSNGYCNEYEFYKEYLIVTKKEYGKEDVSHKIPYNDVSNLRETENYLIICTDYHENLPLDKNELTKEDYEEVLNSIKALCAKYTKE